MPGMMRSKKSRPRIFAYVSGRAASSETLMRFSPESTISSAFPAQSVKFVVVSTAAPPAFAWRTIASRSGLRNGSPAPLSATRIGRIWSKMFRKRSSVMFARRSGG